VALALDWSGVADTDLPFSDYFGADHTLVVRFLPQYAYGWDGPLLCGTGLDVFELGLGAFPGINRVRVPQPYVRLAVGGTDVLLESAGAMAPAQMIADFDSGSYGSWTATGNCFGPAPASGTLPNQNPVSGFTGRGLVNTFLNGDGTTGTLTSPPFTIPRPFIRFLIGGGHHPGRCCINLLVNGRTVRTETGRNNEQLAWRCWDVRDLVGSIASIEIVDLETGEWGHILVDQIESADSPLLQPLIWQVLAIVRAPGTIWGDSLYTPYLNGEKLGPPIPLAAGWVPAGQLRIGGHGFGSGRPGGAPGQFYGFVDEVAVYSRALTQQELRGRVWSPARMTGTEADLIAGWTFPTSPSAQPKLRRPLVLNGAASIVATTPGQSSDIDAARLPPPAQLVRARLPIPTGEEWLVVQEFDERLGTHSGGDAFCWDLGRVSGIGATIGAPVFACATGDVITVTQSDPTDTNNLVEIVVAPDEVHGYLHLQANASNLSTGSRISSGAKVSVIGTLDHLHFAGSNGQDRRPGFVTRPLAFAFYERRGETGPSEGIELGLPRVDECLRRGWSSLYDGRIFPRAYVTAVSRSPDNLDVFLARPDGSVQSAGWKPGTGWRGWWVIGSAGAVPGGAVHAVSRSLDKLDIFLTDANGVIKTAAWQPGFTAWGGWWQIAGGRAARGAPVTAVSRSAEKLDVFVVGTDNQVYTAAWEPNRGGWRGWWALLGGRAAPGAPVTAVSRSADKLDVFVVGTDNQVYTAAWEPAFGWRGWWGIGDVRVPAGAPVQVVCRGPDKLDLFVTDIDGMIKTAAWEPAFGWRGWWELLGGEAIPGASVYPASRSLDKLDVFAVGAGFRASTAAWEPGPAGWQGWNRIRP